MRIGLVMREGEGLPRRCVWADVDLPPHIVVDLDRGRLRIVGTETAASYQAGADGSDFNTAWDELIDGEADHA